MNKNDQIQLKQPGKHISKREPIKIAPPRRNRKLKRGDRNWPINNTALPSPYLPYMHSFPYKCGFAIPLIPISYGMTPPDSTKFFNNVPIWIDNRQDEKMAENMKFLRFPANATGSAQINKEMVSTSEKSQNINLYRNESMPSVYSIKDKSPIPSRTQSVSLLDKSKANSVFVEELVVAFRKLEENVNNFKKFISQNLTEISSTNSPSMIANPESCNYKSNLSIGSSSSETLTVDKLNNKFTFSQRIEEISNQSKESSFDLPNPFHTVTDDLIWVLNQHTVMEIETAFFQSTNDKKYSERRSTVVSTLCLGKGFDHDDWLLFQQLVSHSLSIKEKLKFLNAEAICMENINAGVASLRNSLLSISKYGESIINKKTKDYTAVSFIKLDESKYWSKIKGCLEILQLFGYVRHDHYQLCYMGNAMVTNNIFVAELTLDILILAEEFRLYLDGLHPTPIFVTQLFNRKSTCYGSPPGFQHNLNKTSNHRIEDPDFPPKSIYPISRDKHSSEIKNYESSVGNSEIVIDPQQSENSKHEEANCDFHLIQQLTPKLPPKIKTKTFIKGSKYTKGEDKHNLITKKNAATGSPAEDHIYEEISEVKSEIYKAHMETPPPLPKKHKNLEYLNKLKGKFVMVKDRKKRPAPMPPLFNSNSHPNCTRNNKPIDKYSKTKSHSSFCDQCGKLFSNKVAICQENIEDNVKEKSSIFPVSKIKNCKYFSARDCYVNTKIHGHISQNQFCNINKIYSRSMDRLLYLNPKQDERHMLLTSISLPFMFMSTIFQNKHPHVAYIQKENLIEKFENNKNLILNRNPHGFAKSTHSSSEQNKISEDLTIHLSQKNDMDIDHLLNDQNEFLNFDEIPFIDSTDDHSICSENSFHHKSESLSMQDSLKFPEIKSISNKSLDCLKTSVESLEIKEILFRKSTSNCELRTDTFRLSYTDNIYREPVIFNAQNKKKHFYDPQCEEDRYEIPEVPSFERNGEVPCLPLNERPLQNELSKGIEHPKRPYRKLKSPRLPPKAKENLAPPLPPKSMTNSQEEANVSLKKAITHIKRSVSSPQYIGRRGVSLPSISKSFSSTGLVFIGNSFNAGSMKDVKSKKYWPNIFCSCLTKS